VAVTVVETTDQLHAAPSFLTSQPVLKSKKNSLISTETVGPLSRSNESNPRHVSLQLKITLTVDVFHPEVFTKYTGKNESVKTQQCGIRNTVKPA
jgi:hypothetical protein